MDVSTLIGLNIVMNEESNQLVKGVLSRGGRLFVGGPPRTRKTWLLIDLAISIANGVPWLGFKTTHGRVLYINFHHHAASIRDRLIWVETAKNANNIDDIAIWNLRDIPNSKTEISKLTKTLLKRIRGENYDLIIVDPVYKCFGKRDQDKPEDLEDFMGYFDHISRETGAAIVFDSHFLKNNRKSDTIFMLNPQNKWEMNPEKFNVDIKAYEFPTIENFRLKWEAPLLHRV